MDAYNTELNARMAELIADGLGVHVVPCCAALNYSTDLLSDGVHPNDGGHFKIKQAFETAMGWQPSQPPAVTYTQVPTYRGSDGFWYVDDGANRRKLTVT